MERDQPELIIAFGEGNIEPLGQYGFELDLSGQSGCDLLENLLFLIKSLESPYQLLANEVPVSPEDLDESHTRITIWTDDGANRDFLMRIRAGAFDYDELIAKAEERIEAIDGLYADSDLPETPDRKRLESALVQIREEWYGQESR